jgi:hypothetical protein
MAQPIVNWRRSDRALYFDIVAVAVLGDEWTLKSGLCGR